MSSDAEGITMDLTCNRCDIDATFYELTAVQAEFVMDAFTRAHAHPEIPTFAEMATPNPHEEESPDG